MARYQELTVQDLLVEKIKTLDGSSTISIDDNVSFSDSEGVVYGTGSDVSSYWNGTQFVIAPTTGFWSDCPLTSYPDPSVSYNFFEDFMGFAVDNTTGFPVAWNGFDENSSTTTEAAGGLGGVLALTTGTAAHNSSGIQLGFEGTQTQMEYTKDSGKKSWVEWRVSVGQLDDDYAMFIGLAQEGSAADNFLADTSGIVDNKDFVGFNVLAADGDVILASHRKNSGAVVVVKTPAVVPVAGTMNTFGIYFDGAETVTWYVDGTSVGTADLDTATFPTEEELAPIAYVKTVTGAAILSLDWCKMVVER